MLFLFERVTRYSFFNSSDLLCSSGHLWLVLNHTFCFLQYFKEKSHGCKAWLETSLSQYEKIFFTPPSTVLWTTNETQLYHQSMLRTISTAGPQMAAPGEHHPWVEVCEEALFTSGTLIQVPSKWLNLFTLSLVIFTYGRKQEEKRKLSWKFSKRTVLSLGLIKMSLWRP